MQKVLHSTLSGLLAATSGLLERRVTLHTKPVKVSLRKEPAADPGRVHCLLCVCLCMTTTAAGSRSVSAASPACQEPRDCVYTAGSG